MRCIHANLATSHGRFEGVLEHFRTIGLVNAVDGVPLAVNTLGTETFLVASIGHAWQVIFGRLNFTVLY